jgi:hypothetical protein
MSLQSGVDAAAAGVLAEIYAGGAAVAPEHVHEWSRPGPVDSLVIHHYFEQMIYVARDAHEHARAWAAACADADHPPRLPDFCLCKLEADLRAAEHLTAEWEREEQRAGCSDLMRSLIRELVYVRRHSPAFDVAGRFYVSGYEAAFAEFCPVARAALAYIYGQGAKPGAKVGIDECARWLLEEQRELSPAAVSLLLAEAARDVQWARRELRAPPGPQVEAPPPRATRAELEAAARRHVQADGDEATLRSIAAAIGRSTSTAAKLPFYKAFAARKKAQGTARRPREVALTDKLLTTLTGERAPGRAPARASENSDNPHSRD